MQRRTKAGALVAGATLAAGLAAGAVARGRAVNAADLAPWRPVGDQIVSLQMIDFEADGYPIADWIGRLLDDCGCAIHGADAADNAPARFMADTGARRGGPY